MIILNLERWNVEIEHVWKNIWSFWTLPWRGWLICSQLLLPLQNFLSTQSEETCFIGLHLYSTINILYQSWLISTILLLIHFHLLPSLPLFLEPLVCIDSNLCEAFSELKIDFQADMRTKGGRLNEKGASDKMLFFGLILPPFSWLILPVYPGPLSGGERRQAWLLRALWCLPWRDMLYQYCDYFWRSTCL